MKPSSAKAKGRRLPKITENDVKRQIKQALDLYGIWHFHMRAGLGSYPGLPDRFAVFKRQVWAIEAKRPGGKQSEKQKTFQKNWEMLYGKTYILAEDPKTVIERMHLCGKIM